MEHGRHPIRIGEGGFRCQLAIGERKESRGKRHEEPDWKETIADHIQRLSEPGSSAPRGYGPAAAAAGSGQL